jgi:hypothetical protein
LGVPVVAKSCLTAHILLFCLKPSPSGGFFVAALLIFVA